MPEPFNFFQDQPSQNGYMPPNGNMPNVMPEIDYGQFGERGYQDPSPQSRFGSQAPQQSAQFPTTNPTSGFAPSSNGTHQPAQTPVPPVPPVDWNTYQSPQNVGGAQPAYGTQPTPQQFQPPQDIGGAQPPYGSQPQFPQNGQQRQDFPGSQGYPQPGQPNWQQAPNWQQQQSQQPTPQQAQYSQQDISAIRQKLIDRGYDHMRFGTDDEIIDAFEEMYLERDELDRLKQDVDYYKRLAYQNQSQGNAAPGQAISENSGGSQRFLDQAPQQGQQAGDSANAPQQQKRKWDVPELSETTRQLLARGYLSPDPRTGLYTATDPSLQRYADEYNNHRIWSLNAHDTVVRNPNDFFEQTGLFDRIEQTVQERVQREIDEYESKQRAERVNSEISSFLDQNREWFFEVDQYGQPRVNRAGNAILTPAGKAYREMTLRYKDLGVGDPASRHQLVMSQLSPLFQGQDYGQQQMAAPQFAQQPMQQSQYGQQMPANAGYLPNQMPQQFGQPNQFGYGQPQVDPRQQRQEQFMNNAGFDPAYRTPQQNTAIAYAPSNRGEETLDDIWNRTRAYAMQVGTAA